jgi:cysteine desulfuration protein SufE
MTTIDNLFAVDDFSSVSSNALVSAGDWQHQYRLITQWGRLVTPKPGIRTADNLIKGCELPVWLAHQQLEQRHYFAVDCDSRVISGLAVLLLMHVNARTADELKHINLEACFYESGLGKHLTPSRNNGLKAIIARIYQLLDSTATDASCPI